MHPLLERQIKRHLGKPDGAPPDSGALQRFLAAIDDAYREFDDDRRINERSLSLMSQELTERNAALRHELSEHCKAREALVREKAEQAVLIERLEQAHAQLLQSEKLASIGQLAAGVAHEINNPIGYVFSNFGTLRAYLDDLIRLIDQQITAEAFLADDTQRSSLAALRAEIDYEFLSTDIAKLMQESQEGIERVRKIVQDLKDFSHVNVGQEWSWTDLRRGLQSTLNIVQSELKYRADVICEFGEIPAVQCLASELNQVFLNMLVNAAHSLEGQARGRITIRTEHIDDSVCVSISDTGCGMSAEVINRIFDPFYTTKPVGKGTGLGLSLSYGIVHKHGGRIDVESAPGAGTTFRISLPIRQTTIENKEAA